MYLHEYLNTTFALIKTDSGLLTKHLDRCSSLFIDSCVTFLLSNPKMLNVIFLWHRNCFVLDRSSSDRLLESYPRVSRNAMSPEPLALYHLDASLSALWCIHCESRGYVLAKHAGPLLSRITLSWFHLTEECASCCFVPNSQREFSVTDVLQCLLHSLNCHIRSSIPVSVKSPVPPLCNTCKSIFLS